jgi:HPt (histidine-containing phosphotransfer) domain-containing protein
MSDRGERLIVRTDPELKALIPRYLANRRLDVDEVRRALETDDYETIRLIGHRMKGNGAGYGFDRLTELGGVLERAAMNRNTEVIRTCAADVADYLDRVEVI